MGESPALITGPVVGKGASRGRGQSFAKNAAGPRQADAPPSPNVAAKANVAKATALLPPPPKAPRGGKDGSKQAFIISQPVGIKAFSVQAGEHSPCSPQSVEQSRPRLFPS